MKKVVLKIAVVFLLTLSICFPVFLGNAKAETASKSGGSADTESKNATEEEPVHIFFYPVGVSTDGEGNLVPDGSGKVTVGVRINEKNDGVSLTITTRDKSALAKEGDYESKSKDVYLTSNGSDFLTVQTYKNDAANLIESGKTGYGVTRIFEILICNIKTDSGRDYVVHNSYGDTSEEGKTSLNARVQTLYDYEYSEKDGKNGLYFTDYLYGKSFSSVWFDKDKIYYQTPSGETCITVDQNNSYAKTFSPFIGYDYLLKYRKEGWADIYYGGSATLYESRWSTVNTRANLTIVGKETGRAVFSAEYWDPVNSGAPILFGDTGYSNNSDDYRYHVEMDTSDGYTVINKDDPMYSHAYCYYTRKNYNFPSVTGKVYMCNSEELELAISRDSSWEMDFKYLRLDSELYDTTPPEIESTSLSDLTKTDNKTLRLSVRFSEPVHFKTDTNKAYAYVTGKAGEQSLRFYYAGGEGSDTLYFECDLKNYEDEFSDKIISNITFDGASAFSNACKGVSDYAYNFSLSNNFVDLTKMWNFGFSGVNIDMRKPVVSPNTDGDGTVASKTHSVVLSTGNMNAEGSQVYYTWVKMSDVSGNPDDYVPVKYDYCETKNPLSFTVAGEGLDGEYYLYYKAVSSYGRSSVGHTDALNFDNTAVKISDVSISGSADSALSARDFSLTLEGAFDDLTDGETKELRKIVMRYRAVGEAEWQEKEIYSSSATSNLITLSSEGSDTVGRLRVDGKTDLGMSDGESIRYEFAFVTFDKANNECEYIVGESYVFDTFDKCAVKLTIEGDPYDVYDEITVSDKTDVYVGSAPDPVHAYKNSYQADGFSLTIATKDGIDISGITLTNGDEIVETENYFERSGTASEVTLTYKSEVGGGYFSLQINAKIAGSDVVKYSEVYSFFLAGENDKVNGYVETVNNPLVLNKVFVLKDALYYYWMNGGTKTVNRENYNKINKNLSLAFSSKDIATEYFRHMEAQDLSLYRISSDAEANTLNNGGSNVKKASGETTVAKKGQTWICYKSSSWDQSREPKDWSYYYYSDREESEIDLSKLSSGLRQAIDNVVGKIVNKGEFVYLANDDGLDDRKITKLDSSRIKPNGETLSVTKTGTALKNANTYSFDGDSEIYSYYKAVDGSEYPYAVRELTAEKYTDFYYKSHDKDKYEKLSVSGPFYLKDVITGTGIYDVVERGVNGINKYSVYIDNDSPVVRVSYKRGNSADENKLDINKNYAGTISELFVKTFSFTSLEDDDEYAYVAIFNNDGTLKNTYFSSESGNVSLTDGRYLIKVYDRSGNGFEFYIRINNGDIASSCSVREETNRYLIFTCSYYEKNYIGRFEIYRNGVLIEDNVNSLSSLGTIKLTDGGTYRFYVEDLFGNVYEKEQTFERKLPQVIWYYEKDGSFVKVDESKETLGFVKTELGSSSYSITTKGDVRFGFSSDYYGYDFISGKGTETSNIGGETVVTINKTDNWQVKIYYKDYPDVFVTYIGKKDSSAPTISVVTNKAKYSYADEDAINEYLENLNEGDEINFADVSFSQTDVVTETVENGELVTGGLVKLMISDLSGISKWSYTYNGARVEYTGNMPVGGRIFDKEGDYVIEATDKIGNVSTYSFSIGRSEFTELLADDSEILRDKGNKNIVAKLASEGEFAFVVKTEDGEYKYFKLTTDGTDLKRTILKVASTDGEKYAEKEEKNCVVPSCIYDEDKNYVVKAYISDGKVCVEVALKERTEGEVHKIGVGFRVRSNVAGDCKYHFVELSDELSYLTYAYADKADEKSELNKTLYISKKITIEYEDNTLIARRIVKYSDRDDFASSEGTYLSEDYVCENAGFYQVVVVNAYGNTSTVKIIYQVGISVVGTVKYADGEGLTYSVSYDGDFYSNGSISFKVYKGVRCYVTKDGRDYNPTVEGIDEKNFTVRGNGSYVFTFTDEYGNEVTKYAWIASNDDFVYSDEWLVGFNENALKKSEGYTNSKVYFIKSNLLDCGVKSIIVKTPDGERIGVYDDISERKVGFDEDFLIGDDGDGEYEIIFRDIYGDIAVKVVNYKSRSDLTATRITRDMEKTDYVIDDSAAKNGVWSNRTIKLAVNASTVLSELTVNGEKRDLPYQIDFPSEANNGKYEYVITYLDEYGFSFTFKCVLYRTEITVDSSGVNTVDGVTKDPVAVTFANDYTAKISVNGVDFGEYTSGTRYYQDGNYVISVRDVAGNLFNYEVKRDSVVDFSFLSGTSGQKLVSGEVVNESVRFAPLNGDAVSYYSVYRDGKEIEKYDLPSFVESGKWEIVLKDEAGNKDYFCFYIVTHSLKEFSYTTPDGYKINEVTRDSGGIKVDWSEAVKDLDGGSYLDFDESGAYEVVMTSALTGMTSVFTIAIDKSVPKITLSGVEDGGVTKQNVTIGGYKEGDTVYIYKDGVLDREIKVTASSDVSAINEKGQYTIVVVNEAGGSSQVEFTRVYTANVATSTLIIVIILAVVAGLFAGLLFRKHSRIE